MQTLFKKLLLPIEYDRICNSCGYNVIERKNELSEISRIKMNLINRLEYSEHQLVCISLQVYKIFEGDLFDKIHGTLSEKKQESKP